MIKRYKFAGLIMGRIEDDENFVYGSLNADPQGEWVKWEDVKRLISKITVSDQGIVFSEYELPEFKPEDKKEKCNCQEMFDKSVDLEINHKTRLHLSDEWVCPIHGYKKR